MRGRCAAVEHSGRFGVHFLAHDQEELAARFASKLPEQEKFEGDRVERAQGVPVLDGCLGGLACELRELLPGGDHLIGDRGGRRPLDRGGRAAASSSVATTGRSPTASRAAEREVDPSAR